MEKIDHKKKGIGKWLDAQRRKKKKRTRKQKYEIGPVKKTTLPMLLRFVCICFRDDISPVFW